ncbi:MAG: AprI/Inh family metalloprotease inhibitor [Beijerinckiaceae bacterium]
MSKTMASGRKSLKPVRTGIALPAGLRVAAWLALVVVSSQTQAAVLANAEAAVGQWDLSLADSGRRCRMALRSETAEAGHVLGMPAGCRRALPILAGVNAWRVPARGHLALADVSGTPVLDFVAASDGGFQALGPQGESYRLVPVTSAGHDVPVATPETRRAPGFEPVEVAAGPAKATPPVATVKPNEVAGRYYILREGGKDTGCMLTLDDHTLGLGGNKAALAPACRDQGLVIFDPSGWRIVGGRLVLTARKGHTTHLDQQQDGTWAKDPHEGKPLILKKM